MNKWKQRWQEHERREALAPIAFRTVSICFSAKTVTFDGSTVHVDADCLEFAILSTEKPLLNRKTGEMVG